MLWSKHETVVFGDPDDFDLHHFALQLHRTPRMSESYVFANIVGNVKICAAAGGCGGGSPPAIRRCLPLEPLMLPVGGTFLDAPAVNTLITYESVTFSALAGSWEA